MTKSTKVTLIHTGVMALLSAAGGWLVYTSAARGIPPYGWACVLIGAVIIGLYTELMMNLTTPQDGHPLILAIITLLFSFTGCAAGGCFAMQTAKVWPAISAAVIGWFLLIGIFAIAIVMISMTSEEI